MTNEKQTKNIDLFTKKVNFSKGNLVLRLDNNALISYLQAKGYEIKEE